MSEHDEQVTFFNTLKYWDEIHPELKYIFAVPNGGSRNPIEGRHLKEEGVRPGVPDIICPFPKHQYTCLAIEMKYGKNKQTPEQILYQTILEMAGWQYMICYSGVAALQVVGYYLDLPELIQFALHMEVTP